jgi:CheY-like chemotaxis protein
MPSILIVDDDADFRQGLKLLLERRQYRVLEAADGKQAMLLLQQNGVNLITTDLLMPEQEGIETIQAIRRAHPGAKVVAISAAEPHFLKVAKTLGADEAIPKGMRLDKIVDLLEKLVPA